MSFNDLALDARIMRAIEACGFTSPTEIQTQAIPEILKGNDVMASAQTGTGKTAAFVLPALQRLLTTTPSRSSGPRVLVLTPTRELANQVTENVGQLSRFAKVISGDVVGGMPYPPQIRMLQRPLDILVATPGRLMDHMERGRVDLSNVEILILDEADRMLDMGFVDDVEIIAKQTPSNRQTLLFSATLEGRILGIAQRLLKDPKRIQLAANQVRHESIHQTMHRADDFRHKNRLLCHYIDNPELVQAVVFTATKRGAEQLAKVLAEKGHKSAALHGDMTQHARKRTVERMRRGGLRLLVATDVAARGLDIKGISHVINFDLPMAAEDYIHRIGRTGRGGATGTAVSFVGPDDRRKLVGIERLTGQKIEHSVISGLEPSSPEPRRSTGGARPGGFQKHRPRPFGAASHPSANRADGKPSAGKRPSNGNGARFSDNGARHQPRPNGANDRRPKRSVI